MFPKAGYYPPVNVPVRIWTDVKIWTDKLNVSFYWEATSQVRAIYQMK
ncbi:MAG TPA: hypothetical protein HA306_08875 [Methanosarcina sp.]|nr:hypothetical protein [Methanosarcina sp.]